MIFSTSLRCVLSIFDWFFYSFSYNDFHALSRKYIFFFFLGGGLLNRQATLSSFPICKIPSRTDPVLNTTWLLSFSSSQVIFLLWFIVLVLSVTLVRLLAVRVFSCLSYFRWPDIFYGNCLIIPITDCELTAYFHYLALLELCCWLLCSD